MPVSCPHTPQGDGWQGSGQANIWRANPCPAPGRGLHRGLHSPPLTPRGSVRPRHSQRKTSTFAQGLDLLPTAHTHWPCAFLFGGSGVLLGWPDSVLDPSSWDGAPPPGITRRLPTPHCAACVVVWTDLCLFGAGSSLSLNSPIHGYHLPSGFCTSGRTLGLKLSPWPMCRIRFLRDTTR